MPKLLGLSNRGTRYWNEIERIPSQPLLDLRKAQSR